MHDLTSNLSGRRHFLASSAMSVSSLATAWLLNDQQLLADNPEKPSLVPLHYDLTPKAPHATPRATAMISLFMQGGPSHIDLTDPKPLLKKYHMQPFPGEIDLQQDCPLEASSKTFASPWKFEKHGECGTEISELLPGLASIVDEVTLIRSMHTSVNNHEQSIRALNTGRIQAGRPALGSWLTYGLGAETDQLPAFVAMLDPNGLPVEGIRNWSNGWLPSLYQGTVIRSEEPRILNLDAQKTLNGKAQDNFLSYLSNLNRRHRNERPGELDLDARIATFELAARMQLAAKEALDISKETKATLEMYGIGQKETDSFGNRCLLARRLVERGVRFVQILPGYQKWDHHGSIVKSLPEACRAIDQPATALVNDLKQRGLLDTTIVHWGGEMGRLPVIQNENNIGRDHNTHGFSQWLAGGGFRGGVAYGNTDEFGVNAVENPVSHSDYHATLLHLFGLNPKRLTYRVNNRDQSLLDNQQGRVVTDLLA
jgi:hypothetical protein